jgi:hypothetical protein
MCGGPRVPGGYGGEVAAGALKQQKKHLAAARLASIATLVQASFAALATLIGLAAHPASIAGKVLVVAIAIVPLILALRARSRATSARESARTASERAWQAAAEDVAGRAKSGITAPALAKTLGIEPAYADRLLTSLAVHERTRIDVGENAEVVYSVQPGALVRVAEDGHRDEERDDGALVGTPEKERAR